ncbi:ABC transporter type 1 [Gracilaria domingensis]|nr:ABC transporter type 1 [Gracilaria domingensis]KAI0562000.1 ABC transporter type 1 [Gracilaria domingensis]
MHRFIPSLRTALVLHGSKRSSTAVLHPELHSCTNFRIRGLSSSASAKPLPLLTRLQRLVSSATQNLNASSTSSDNPEGRLQISRLLSLARPEKGLIGFALSAQLVSASSMMLFPFALGRVVDAVTGTGPTDLDTLVLAMGGVFTVSAIASATRVAAMSLAGSRISRQLRVSLFHSILRQETAFFDRRQSGELVNRLSSDVPLVSRTLTENLAKMLRNGVTTVSSLTFILYLSPKLSLVTICSIPPIVGFAFIFGRTARKLSRQLVDALAAATQVAAERTSAIRTVRTFGAEGFESSRYAKQVDETYSLAKKVAVADALYSGSVQLSAQMSLVGVLWFGGRMVVNPLDPMTIGTLTSFAMYAVNLGVSVSAMGTSYGQLLRAMGAGYRIFEILDRHPEGRSSTIVDLDLSATNRHPPLEQEAETNVNGLEPGYDATVRFNDVHFSYPTHPDNAILRGVDLVIRPGEIVAIAGGSGSGKSTVGALLSRLYEPNSGAVELGNTSIAKLDTVWLRNQVAVVSQEPVLFDGSVADNIKYAMPGKIGMDKVHEAAKSAASHKMIMGLPKQYDTRVGERGSSLSGGQRARTALSRALARRPRVLVLDEHSAALDAGSERAVGDALSNAASDLNMAVLTIAHRTSSLRRADRVAVLVEGRVAELDSYEKLMSNPTSHLRRMLVPEIPSKDG